MTSFYEPYNIILFATTKSVYTRIELLLNHFGFMPHCFAKLQAVVLQHFLKFTHHHDSALSIHFCHCNRLLYNLFDFKTKPLKMDK